MSKQPRVLLLGAAGQVGVALQKTFADCAPIALDRSGADLGLPETLRAVVRDMRPDLILNAAAYTAVDRAESEPELADRVNHQAVRVLAEEAERARALLVHYSTDYVFDGTKTEPWVETDPTGPLNVYGASKLAGEQAIQNACSRYIILRTSWVYSASGNNFLRTMLRLGRERDVLRVVNDQWGAPTSAGTLADATRAVIDSVEQVDDFPARSAGVYHATSSGYTSWCGFAEAIFKAYAEREHCFIAPMVEGIASGDYPTSAKRPRNSVLSNGKLAECFSLHLPHWEEALRLVVHQIV